MNTASRLSLTRLLLTGIVLPLLGLILGGCASKAPPPQGYLRAGENLWKGVTVYNQDLMKSFVVLGGHDAHKFPDGHTGPGVKIDYPDGRTGWKDRDDITREDTRWFVKANDPALPKQQWQVLED